MKNLLIVVMVVSTLFLLVHNTVFAEPTHPNEVGLYTTNDGTGATGTFVVGTPVSVYLVLTRPTDVDNGGVPFNVVTGLELTLHFNPAPNDDLIVMETILPPGSVDIGRYKDINEGILEFVVGIPDNEAVIVVNEAATLIEFTFLNLSPGITEVSLQPNADFQSVAGEMGFLGGEIAETPYVLLAMYSMGGSHDASVFEFNGEAVAVEIESFGSVKALFR